LQTRLTLRQNRFTQINHALEASTSFSDGIAVRQQSCVSEKPTIQKSYCKNTKSQLGLAMVELGAEAW
jgi:hypothetical protein